MILRYDIRADVISKESVRLRNLRFLPAVEMGIKKIASQS